MILQLKFIVTANSNSGLTDDIKSHIFYKKVKMVRFEVYFGDGVLGKKPVDGNILLILEYIVTNKTEANGASSFTLSGDSRRIYRCYN